MNPLVFENQYVSMQVQITDRASVQLRGKILQRAAFDYVEVMAPAPIDRMTNYSGSGLPFPCAAIALENTPNHITVGHDGLFAGTFAYPNSYYTEDAFQKVVASIFVVMHKANQDPIIVRMELPEPVPLTVRTLTHRPKRTDPEFYRVKEDIIGVQGAEATMRALANVKVYMGLA